MFEPSYDLTHRILNNLIKLELDRKYVTDKEVKESAQVGMEERAKALNILHIGHLIGINLTVKDAEKLAEGKRLETEDMRGTILNNFRNVLEFTRSNVADSYSDIDINILVHLNKILLTDWKETWDAKLRLGGEEPDPTHDNWIEVRDRGLESILIQDKLMDVINWFKSNSSKIHPIIRTAIVIYEIIRISPFAFLNKLTAIAAADYLLHKSGYGDDIYLPVCRNFDVYEDEYIESWNNAVQGKLDPMTNQVIEVENITLWIERFIRSLSNDIVEVKDFLMKKVTEDEKSIKQPFLDLNKRQLKILRYLQTIPTVKREDYVQMMDVSTMTAFRDLTELTDKKLLKVVGKGRGTKYMLITR